MLTQTFVLDETIQAVDPGSGYRWEKAQILSFVNDWCVKIKWLDWSGKKVYAEITVPEIDRVDQVSTIAIIQKLILLLNLKFEFG